MAAVPAVVQLGQPGVEVDPNGVVLFAAAVFVVAVYLAWTQSVKAWRAR